MASRATQEGNRRFAEAVRLNRQKRKPFKPFVPGRPGAPYYDPILDQQERASGRGLADLMQDAARESSRRLSDYHVKNADITRERNESLQDLQTQRQHGTEDYQRNVGNLDLQFSRLANRQAQGAAAAGVGGGGALAQALQKRQGNYKLERDPMDVQHNRFLQANTLADTRTREAATRAWGGLDLQMQRGEEDLNQVEVPRAQRENVYFGLDTAETRNRQAQDAGWDPYADMPPGQFLKGNTQYRTNTAVPVRQRRYTLPSGRTFNRRQWTRHIKKKGGF